MRKAAAEKEVDSTSSSLATLAPPTSSSLLLRAIEGGLKDERRDAFEVWGAIFGRKVVYF
jgi:hypothetical protein